MAAAAYISGITANQFRHPMIPRSNITINSPEDDKPILINSRDFAKDANNNIGLQCKPRQASGTTSSITGAEFSPRFASGVAGGQIRAIAASPFLQGTTGDLSSNVVAVEAEFSLGTNSSRTITGGVHALRTILDCSGIMTVTGKKSVIKVDAPLSAGDWDYFLQLDSPTLLVAATNAVIDHAIPIRVGSTNYWIGVYDATS